jgi:hypothetical protein
MPKIRRGPCAALIGVQRSRCAGARGGRGRTSKTPCPDCTVESFIPGQAGSPRPFPPPPPPRPSPTVASSLARAPPLFAARCRYTALLTRRCPAGPRALPPFSLAARVGRLDSPRQSRGQMNVKMQQQRARAKGFAAALTRENLLSNRAFLSE